MQELAAGLVRAYTCKIGNKTAAVAGVIPFLRKFQKGLNYGGCKSCWPRPAKKCSPWAPTSYLLHNVMEVRLGKSRVEKFPMAPQLMSFLSQNLP